MKKNIAIFLFFIAVGAKAQIVPGYLGKKFLIGVNYQYSPLFGTFIGNSMNDKELVSGFGFLDMMTPSPKLSLEFKAVVSPQTTFNIGVATQKMIVAKDYVQWDYPNVTLYNEIKTNITQINIGISKHGYHVAPVGFYGTFSGFVAILNTEIVKEGSLVSDNTSIDFGYTQGFGARRIIGDRIALDLGVDFNVNIIGLYSFLKGGGFRYESIETRAEGIALLSNYLNNFIVMRAGASYLF